jgi:hypothetical protein
VKTFIRMMPVLFACVATQAYSSEDPPTTPAPVEAVKPATPAAAPAATADTPTPTTPAPAPAAPQRLVLEDKTLTAAEVNHLLSQGYKPQKGRGDTVLYCRSESQLGTHFEKKVCMSADQIKTRTRESRDITEGLQRNFGQPTLTPGASGPGAGPK